MKTVEGSNKQFIPFPGGSESIIFRDLKLDPNKNYEVYIRNNKYIDWISQITPLFG